MATAKPTAWERVEADIAAGRLWKARDRLHGMLVASPTDQKILDRLGELYFQMGDAPQAGRYWFLTTRDDEAALQARTAFHDRFGNEPISFAKAIPALASSDAYPDIVQVRLHELEDYLRPGIVRPKHPPYRPSFTERLFMSLFGIVALIVFVGGWLFGVGTFLNRVGGATAVWAGAALVIAIILGLGISIFRYSRRARRQSRTEA